MSLTILVIPYLIVYCIIDFISRKLPTNILMFIDCIYIYSFHKKTQTKTVVVMTALI